MSLGIRRRDIAPKCPAIQAELIRYVICINLFGISDPLNQGFYVLWVRVTKSDIWLVHVGLFWGCSILILTRF